MVPTTTTYQLLQIVSYTFIIIHSSKMLKLFKKSNKATAPIIESPNTFTNEFDIININDLNGPKFW